MNTCHPISIDPRICHGKPVIRGTRVPIAIVVGSLAGGMSFEETAAEYDLTGEDIQAALAFASALVQEESFHPLPGAARPNRQATRLCGGTGPVRSGC